MSESLLVEVEVPGDLARFRLPAGVQSRLTELLDRQDSGQPLTDAERREAEGLVDLADLLTLLRLRAESVGETDKPANQTRPRPPVTGIPKAGQYEGRLVVPGDFDEALEELNEPLE
jgi:hypothetical protein